MQLFGVVKGAVPVYFGLKIESQWFIRQRALLGLEERNFGKCPTNVY